MEDDKIRLAMILALGELYNDERWNNHPVGKECKTHIAEMLTYYEEPIVPKSNMMIIV